MHPYQAEQQHPVLRTFILMTLRFPNAQLPPPAGWQLATLADILAAVEAQLRQHDANPLSRVPVPPQDERHWLNEAVEHVVRGGDASFTPSEREAIAERLRGRPHLVPYDRAFGARLVVLARRLRPTLSAQQLAALRHAQQRDELWHTLDELRQAARSLSPLTPVLVPAAFDPRLVRHGLAETRAASRARR